MSVDRRELMSPRTKRWGQERRFRPRVEVRWPVVVLTNCGAIVAETRNIGPRGAFICHKPPLLPKEKLKLFIMVPNRRALVVGAEVAWSNLYGSEMDSTPSGMGVYFRKISNGDRRLLEELVLKHRNS